MNIDFDLETFQSDVLREITGQISGGTNADMPVLVNVVKPQKTIEISEENNLITVSEKNRSSATDNQSLSIKSEVSIPKSNLLEIICPHLKGATEDAYDIGKAFIPALVAAVAAGTILIPLEPFIFAGIAIFMAKRGAALCPQKNDQVSS